MSGYYSSKLKKSKLNAKTNRKQCGIALHWQCSQGHGLSHTVGGCANYTTSLEGTSETHIKILNIHALCPKNSCLGIYPRDVFEHLHKGKCT